MDKRRLSLVQELIQKSENSFSPIDNDQVQAMRDKIEEMELVGKAAFNWNDDELGFTIKQTPIAGSAEAFEQRVDGMSNKDRGEQSNTSPTPLGVLKSGGLSPSNQTFCSLYKLLNFSYLKVIKKDLPQGLKHDFLEKDVFWNRQWHLYYIWSSSSIEPVIVFPECDFRDFMQDINVWFPGSDLCSYWTYQKYRDIELLIDFPDHPRFTPRYLGLCCSRQEYKALALSVPSKDVRRAAEPVESPIDQDDIAAFDAIMRGQIRLQLELKGRSTIDLLPKSQLQRKADMIVEKKRQKKEKQARKRLEAADMFKRAQKYLGMRPAIETEHPLPRLHPNQAVPHTIADSTALVCFDVESWERDHSIITEIGLAVLPLAELREQPAPGITASHWHPLIQAHHFRIIEHSNFRNVDFVQGNPYGFKFGTSQEISIAHASIMIEDLFDSVTGANSSTTNQDEQVGLMSMKEIVLVGHAVQGDIRYLEKIGFNVAQHVRVIDTLDTQTLWHVLNSFDAESNNAGLAKLLTALDLSYNGLHNAGNDAVYTMRAMLAMMVLEGTLREEKT